MTIPSLRWPTCQLCAKPVDHFQAFEARDGTVTLNANCHGKNDVEKLPPEATGYFDLMCGIAFRQPATEPAEVAAAKLRKKDREKRAEDRRSRFQKGPPARVDDL